LQTTEKALRAAHDELELRVRERTSQLARANEELRSEIAERRRMEEALRVSEKTARALLNAPMDLAVLVDPEGTILDVNETYARRFGRRVEDLIGTCVWDLFTPEVSEYRKALLDRVRESGQPQRIEEERVEAWFDTVAYPILDPKGEVSRLAVFARDITDRKRAEVALRASEERWRTLVENAPDLVLTVDRAARILFVNRVLLGTGLTPDDYIGRDVSEYAMPEARELTRQAIERVFVEESDGYFEARGRLSNGRVAWYATRLAPVRQDGTVVAVMMIARDITDRKEIDEMKDNLIRDVSHELRTPLAKMQMSMELLLEILGKEPINRQRAIGIGQMVFGNTRRLLQTVEAILDLSALEAGRVVYDKIKFLPADLMNEMLQYMRPMAEAKRLELVVRVQEDLPTVEGDLDKLTRVMINLIDNAIKFSDRGQIVLWAQRNGQEVEFAVSDNGYGVLKENLERIFEKFYQERISISGAGVGLPICKTIVEAHGGAIWAESPGRGQGTTVRFTLPTRVNGEE
jgi:PAS domain S-box-containing protein